MRVFVDDITALLMGKNKEVAGKAKKVLKRLREEVERKGFKVSVNENGKEGKSNMIASCNFLEEKLRHKKLSGSGENGTENGKEG